MIASILLVLIVFIVALVVTLLWGPVLAFAYVYLPSLIVLSMMTPLEIPLVPAAPPPVGALYGILIGSLLAPASFWKLRLNAVDIVMALLVASAVITAVRTEQFWTGVSAFGATSLGLLAPYLLARKAFESGETRRAMLWAVIASLSVVLLFALIEARLWPWFFKVIQMKLGLHPGGELPGTYRRMGFFRAASTFQHPIDLGNSALVLGGMILMLATTTMVGLRNWLVWAGVAMAGIGLLASISFTPMVGLAVFLALLGTLLMWCFARRMMLPIVLAMILGGVLFTEHLLNRHITPPDQLSPNAPAAVEGSFFIRTLIVQHSWPLFLRSGLFGWGNTITRDQIDLESVDNTYILHGLRHGYVYLALWLSIPVFLAWRAGRAFARCDTARQIAPLAIAMATVLGIMVAMYTVWAGAIYATLWYVLLGFTGTLMDLLTIQVPMAKILPRRLARVRK